MITKDLKAVALAETRQYVLEKSRPVTDILTKNHRKVLQQFIEYKKQTDWRIKDFEDKELARALEELNQANQAPVEEAEYHVKRIKHLPLWDCLVPRLRVLKKPKGSKQDKKLDS